MMNTHEEVLVKQVTGLAIVFIVSIFALVISLLVAYFYHLI